MNSDENRSVFDDKPMWPIMKDVERISSAWLNLVVGVWKAFNVSETLAADGTGPVVRRC